MKPSVFLVEIWVLNEVYSLVLNGSFYSENQSPSLNY